VSTPSAPKKRILVVEDDESVRELVARALSTKYEVVTAPDGLAASELIATIEVPDLLICDVMMPKVDGFRFVKLIKSDPKYQKLDVIFLTAKGGAPALVQGIQLGARHFISKPFNVKDLLDKVAKILG
jgi:CheY-like chemotaxis protein